MAGAPCGYPNGLADRLTVRHVGAAEVRHRS